ncbi:hypothetical protein D9619_001877 [Psilocybe cf. subviscida]|uniref:SEC7 domain-containing protein n=1 Tax=Psilocybe cf. subviscida TaxID=2480587 RepID=A0A8H5BE01_9AGAR|nr:hypothetical protein D9619_001877 [Psilocybe cf. subviscida]
MADQDTPPSRAATPARAPSRAEQRMAAVAKLKRAASLPRMKDGRRPPMHVEAVSEGEKPQLEQPSEQTTASNTPEPPPLPTTDAQPQDDEFVPSNNEDVEVNLDPEAEDLTPIAQRSDGISGEPEGDAEGDSDPDEGGSPAPTASTKKRRTRSRTRSRASKDLKARLRASQQAMQAPLTGDSSPEVPPAQTPFLPPGVVLSPIPHLPFLHPPNRFLRPGTPGLYPGTNPPTPLPTLEDIQQGLMRSNSAGASAAGRRAAMHKLTGGTESYDVPVPTPPIIAKLSRNNTVAGGERIAARRNMLNLLGTRVNKEAEAEAASGAEERNTASPTPKRRKRRSRRASSNANANIVNVSESDYNSTNPNTPANSNTVLPAVQDYYDFAELRAQSTTPNQLSSPLGLMLSHNFEEASRPPLPINITPPAGDEGRGPELGRRRSVLIEDPDEDDRESPEQPYGTPRIGLQQNDENTRSDGPSSGSTDSGVGVPVFLSGRSTSRNDVYPSSPFTTPLKEVTVSDEDDDRVLYPASAVRPRTPYANQVDNFDREISWIASPVPEIRMPIDDDDEDYDDDEPQQDIDVEVNIDDYEEPASATSSNGFDIYDDNTRETFDENSPPASSSSKSVLVESETSPEPVSAYMPASPSSPVPYSSHAPSVDGSSSPQFFPTRLSVASRMGGESSDWEEKYTAADTSKRQGASTWEKVMNTFSRAGSSAGRRSRTNSIVARERRDNTDSSVSRESGASLTSSRTDKGDSQIQAPPLMQTPSASASISSLAPHAPPRGNVSPIPPPLSSDLAKYTSAKLFPFPGIMKLEEERRARVFPDASPQDEISTQTSETHSNTPTQTPDMHRERELAQPSEGPIFPVYMGEPSDSGPSSPGYGYIDVSPSTQSPNGGTPKLPTTLPGVKQWLSKNSAKKKLFSGGTPNGSMSHSPIPSVPSPSSASKKTFISDVFSRKPNDVSTDFEESGPAPMLNHELGSTSNLAANRNDSSRMRSPDDGEITGKGQNSKTRNITPLNLGSNGSYKFPNNALEAAAARLASPTPVSSSFSDYPAPSASDSSSTTSSNYSLAYHGQAILERLDENLNRPSRTPIWAGLTDDPPRKLVLSSPVLQVVNPNTVKDRFLFLFNDILVIAKPVTHNQDNLMDTYNRINLPDRKYTVKSVVQLRNLRFFVDRFDTQARMSSVNPRNPLMLSFISQFAKEPDHAVGSLFTKANVTESSQILGQLLFKTLELDRSRLGEYLARRTSKTALKHYLDSFGFAGLRIDVALRVFLQSLNLSQHPQFYTALDHLLDAFASRWYEANAKFVPYDKDMAIRLVWALAQLNERLHGGIADEAGETNHSQRTVSNKEFVDAFRKYDVRGLVSDDSLQDVYRSIYHERLSQARLSSPSGPQETSITIKRPLPSTLTYKAQSDPIVFRLPAADPDLTVELYGQDLIFEPPVLQFLRSPEASFRVTGTSLGPKSITMLKTGPNAINYSGLPPSHTVNVERSFMRHTFQVAFLNQTGSKRRYMFSVDDPIIRNEWATCIRRHVELSIVAAQSPSDLTSQLRSKVFKASSDVAFKVLRDTLMAKNADAAPRATDSPVLQKRNGTSIPFSGSVRSKSRSRMYHKYGPGKNEEELGHSSSISRESNDSTPESDPVGTPEHPLDGALWTARDLEIQCQQNSAIPHILALLQVGSSDRPPS